MVGTHVPVEVVDLIPATHQKNAPGGQVLYLAHRDVQSAPEAKEACLDFQKLTRHCLGEALAAAHRSAGARGYWGHLMAIDVGNGADFVPVPVAHIHARLHTSQVSL